MINLIYFNFGLEKCKLATLNLVRMSLIKNIMNIPDQYNIKKTIEQKTYLVDGQLNTWSGETANIYSTISSSTWVIMSQPYWALFHTLSEKNKLLRHWMLQVLPINKGQGLMADDESG